MRRRAAPEALEAGEEDGLKSAVAADGDRAPAGSAADSVAAPDGLASGPDDSGSTGFVAEAFGVSPGRRALEDERDFCLRSLRDLEAEWEAGDIDPADYRELKDSYTTRAAVVLRQLDEDLSADEAAREEGRGHGGVLGGGNEPRTGDVGGDDLDRDGGQARNGRAHGDLTADILAGDALAGAAVAGDDLAGAAVAGDAVAGAAVAGAAVAGDAVAGDAVAGTAVAGTATLDLLATDGSAADDDSLDEAAPRRIGRRRPIRGTEGDAPARARNRWTKWVLIGLGVVLVAGGVAWAVAASSGTRLPGEEITGQALGPEAATQSLQAAEQAVGKGDDVTALKDFQTVLSSYPNQPEALTGAGWILAQTQQPSLLQQGLTMLTSAEKADPSYAPAHLYRGVTLLSEDNYAGAIPELRWYLAHSPDPQLKAKVQSALQTAVTKQGQAQKTNAGG